MRLKSFVPEIEQQWGGLNPWSIYNYGNSFIVKVLPSIEFAEPRLVVEDSNLKLFCINNKHDKASGFVAYFANGGHFRAFPGFVFASYGSGKRTDQMHVLFSAHTLRLYRTGTEPETSYTMLLRKPKRKPAPEESDEQ